MTNTSASLTNPFDPDFTLSNSRDELMPLSGPQKTAKALKDVPAVNGASVFSGPVQEAINNDDVDRLGHLLGTVKLCSDVMSRAGSYFRQGNGQDGIHQLLRLCVKASAVRCLYYLTLWCQSPKNPFRYDIRWLYQCAKKVAVRTGHFASLLALDLKTLEKPADREALFALLLVHAHSPDALHRLTHALGPESKSSFDYYPFLLLKTADPTSQPSIIEAFAETLVRHNGINEVDRCRGAAVSPISSAAGALHISAIEVLINMGAQPFGVPFNHTAKNQDHPLFRALSQQLKSKQPPGTPAWRSEIRPIASRMHTTVAILLNAAPNPFKNTSAFKRIMTKATTIYVKTLCAFLFGAIVKLPDDKSWLRHELLHNPEETHHTRAAWRGDLHRGQLKETLETAELAPHRDFFELWALLLTPEIVEAVERHLRRPFGSPPLNAQTCLWTLLGDAEQVEEILKLPRERDDVKKVSQEQERFPSPRSPRSPKFPPSSYSEEEEVIFDADEVLAGGAKLRVVDAEEILCTPRPFRLGRW